MFYIVFETGKRTKISIKIGWRTTAWCRRRIHFAQAWFCYLQSGSEVSLNDLTCFQRDLDKFDKCLFIEQRDLEPVELLSRPSVVIVHLLIRDLNGPSDWFNSQHDFHVKNNAQWNGQYFIPETAKVSQEVQCGIFVSYIYFIYGSKLWVML